jgi:hypothetical protein
MTKKEKGKKNNPQKEHNPHTSGSDDATKEGGILSLTASTSA